MQSNVTEATANAFTQGDLEVELTSIPGVGPKSAVKLQAAGVKSTMNLLGKFLTILDAEATTKENCVSMEKL
jgi:recombinational DNA repair protein RecR